jgi:hypothetical protein
MEKTLASWGVDAVKVDWCHHPPLPPQYVYTLFRDALNKTGIENTTRVNVRCLHHCLLSYQMIEIVLISRASISLFCL